MVFFMVLFFTFRLPVFAFFVLDQGTLVFGDFVFRDQECPPGGFFRVFAQYHVVQGDGGTILVVGVADTRFGRVFGTDGIAPQVKPAMSFEGEFKSSFGTDEVYQVFAALSDCTTALVRESFCTQGFEQFDGFCVFA